MKRKLFLFYHYFNLLNLFFGEDFPKNAKTVNNFIPKGWKILKR